MRARGLVALALLAAGCAAPRTGMTLAGDDGRGVDYATEDPSLLVEISPLDDRPPFARHRLVVTNAGDVAIDVERADLLADGGATIVPALVYPPDDLEAGAGMVAPGHRTELVLEVAEGTSLPTAGEGAVRLHYRWLPLDRTEFVDVPVRFVAGNE